MIDSIVEAPQSAGAIVARATALLPAKSDRLARAAREAFPGFAHDIGPAVAASAVPSEPGDHERPTVAADADAARGWSGEVDLGASLATGNTERTALSGSTKVILDQIRWTHEFRARADFAEDQEETTEQRVFASLETNYKIDARLYVFGKASYEDDRFSGFDYRITETAGLGYRVIDTDDVTFNVELGPGARQTRVRATDEFENEAVGSLSGDFAWRVSEGAEITEETSVIVGSERTTIDTTAALTTEIVDPIAARFSFNLRHDTDVPADSESTDTLTKASLVYKF
jgi:putative salt-induced outer membrane protein